MAEEPKDSPAPEKAAPGREATITEGARAEAGAAKASASPPPEPPAATADTFKTAPSAQPVEAAPAVAGGTNAPQVSQPAVPAAPTAPTTAKPAPVPAPAAVAAAAKATATPAAAGTAPAPAAAKPAAKPAAAADGDLTRRGFFSWAAVAWVGFTVAIGGCVTAMGRFMFPNVLFEPPTTFKVGRPEDFQAGVVDTRFVDKYGVWVINNDGRIYSLIAICTHLGCPPAWLDTQNKFKCPCHGSGYYKSGINFEGPTPRPLERAKISISPDDGQIVIDKAQKFQWELGQWEDPNAFIPVKA